LFFRREIHIRGILLQSPQIHIIRSEEGNFNIHNVGRANWTDGDKTAVIINPFSSLSSSAAKPSSNSKQITAPPSSSLKETIRFIRVQDASISYIDQSQAMPLDIWLLNINMILKGLSLSDPFELSFDSSPLLLKGIAPGAPDSPVLKDVTGKVQLNMAIGTSGDLSANGDIATTGGVIKDFNIIKTVLSHTLGAYGGMEGNIDDILNGPLKEKLGAEDTDIEKGMDKFSIHDKNVFIDDSLIETDIFEFKAQGSMGQGSNVDLQTMLHLNSDVSAALVNEIDGLKFLCDDSKRIAIGASLSGVIPHLKYKPNKEFRKKSKKALIEEGAGILGALFGGR
jgi:hypothetical protein